MFNKLLKKILLLKNIVIDDKINKNAFGENYEFDTYADRHYL